MKQIIRFNTFETNSSSMHSLVVSKNVAPYNKEELSLYSYDDEKYELFGCCDSFNFERFPFEVLASPKDKLRYYVAYYCGSLENKDKVKEVKEFIHKQTNIKIKNIDITSYAYRNEDYGCGYKYGYVRCNDTGEDVFHYLESHNISMEEFILNPKYTVIIDGDEYCNFSKLFIKGIITGDTIEDISSGKDFWLHNNIKYSMYYINQFDEQEVFNKELENIKLMLSNDWYKKLIIEDYDLYDTSINKQSLNKFIIMLQLVKEKGLKVQLNLYKNKEEDYNIILPYIDEIKYYNN